jgi:hypothetical protein
MMMMKKKKKKKKKTGKYVPSEVLIPLFRKFVPPLSWVNLHLIPRLDHGSKRHICHRDITSRILVGGLYRIMNADVKFTDSVYVISIG